MGTLELSRPQPSPMALSELGWGLLAFTEQSPGLVLMNLWRREHEGGPRNLRAELRSSARLQWAGTWAAPGTLRPLPRSHAGQPSEFCRRGRHHLCRSAQSAGAHIMRKTISSQSVPRTHLAGPSPALSFEFFSRLM